MIDLDSGYSGNNEVGKAFLPLRSLYFRKRAKLCTEITNANK